MKRILSIVMLLPIVQLLSTTHAEAQCNYILPEEVQDSVMFDRVLPSGDTLAPGLAFPYYQFQFIYDSSAVFYTFTELEHNSSKVELEWINGQELKTIDADSLSSLSHSRSITVSSSDTISFSREFTWKGPNDPASQYLNNYCAQDTIEIIVGLIDNQGTWIQTLDSFGVLRQTTPGVPVLYGNDPSVMTHITTTIGGNYTNKPRKVAVKIIVKGDGDYYPIRKDNWGGRISAVLNDPEWADFRTDVGLLAPKINTQQIKESDYAPVLTVWPNPTVNGRINIDVAVENEGRRSIGIYNHVGQRIFVPLTNFSSRTVHSSYQLPASGTYYVVLYDGQQVEAIKTVSVAN